MVIGDLLIEFIETLRLYAVYAVGQDSALASAEELIKKKDIAAHFQKCESNPLCKGNTVNSFLIKPIQRLCKYPLLLRELVKHTLKDHPDYEPLQKAYENMGKVVDYVNETKRNEEKNQRSIAIAQKFQITELFSQGRSLYKEGKVYEWEEKGGKVERYLFLFDDLIIMMKPNTKEEKSSHRKTMNDKLLFKKMAQSALNDANIVDVASEAPVEGEEPRLFCFELTFGTTPHLFSALNDADKQDWIKLFRKCLKANQLKQWEARRSEKVIGGGGLLGDSLGVNDPKKDKNRSSFMGSVGRRKGKKTGSFLASDGSKNKNSRKRASTNMGSASSSDPKSGLPDNFFQKQ